VPKQAVEQSQRERGHKIDWRRLHVRLFFRAHTLAESASDVNEARLFKLSPNGRAQYIKYVGKLQTSDIKAILKGTKSVHSHGSNSRRRRVFQNQGSAAPEALTPTP
jgi:hypothetical protein